MSRSLLVGVFVGGRGSRMGGTPKGLLRAPDTGETLVARLRRLAAAVLEDAECVLVGESAPYAGLGLRAVPDLPAGEGPLGGLQALLVEGEASEREVLALACDLPFVTASLVERLASHSPGAPAVAPRDGERGRWEPLFARYAPRACRPVVETLLEGDRRALQAVFDALGGWARPLPLEPEDYRLLRDWDTPDDVVKTR